MWARSDPDGRIRGFLVERGTEGFSTPSIEGKFSLRASATGQIVLEDCHVPLDNLLPDAVGIEGEYRLVTMSVTTSTAFECGLHGPTLDCPMAAPSR